jgi:hypothetical protein
MKEEYIKIEVPKTHIPVFLYFIKPVKTNERKGLLIINADNGCIPVIGFPFKPIFFI